MTKKHILDIIKIPAAAAAAIFLCISVQAAESTATANIHKNNYRTYGTVVTSYLYESTDGMVRVEYTGKNVIAEKYDENGKFVSTVTTVTPPLPIFGGFYSGKEYNYLAFGQQNPTDDENAEVIRLLKYTKDWEPAGECSVYGENTYRPFDFGSARFEELGDMLYLYTCHEMFESEDGLHHQSNMQCIFNTKEMTLLACPLWPYSSHSFNQFIKTDGTYMFTADHGDAYPRAVVLNRYDAASTSYYYPKTLEIFPIVGSIGDNFTGVSVGGMELSDENVLVIGNSADQNEQTIKAFNDRQRNVFLNVVPKDMSTSATIWLTNYEYSDLMYVYTPCITKTADDVFVASWEEYDPQTAEYTTKTVKLDGSGNKLSESSSAVPLSDCAPVLFGSNAVRWYVTDSSVPVFYELDTKTLKISKVMKLDFGDVNCDGSIAADDSAYMLQKALVNTYKLPIQKETENWMRYADVSGNGSIEADDAAAVMQKALVATYKMPVER